VPPSRPEPNSAGRRGTVGEVFIAFLRLGVMSFGGPVAHLCFFREDFVQRRRWLTDRAYADLVALCQFLPGPASSQVGMAIGLHRAGLAGLVAAWLAFTLPSTVLLVAFGYGASALGDAAGTGWITGLKAAALAVVAHALLGMAKTLTPDLRRALIAIGALTLVLIFPGVWVQVAVMAAAAIAGLACLRVQHEHATEEDSMVVRIPRVVGAAVLGLFVTLLIVLPLLAGATRSGAADLADSFYRSGALVFGGGHVVLPLLHAETVATGLVSEEAFLAGYGAAQAVPGPLFTVAAYLGSLTAAGPWSLLGATIALVAIFLPGALLVIGVLPFWERLRRSARAQRALLGVNAGVVGLLGGALYTTAFAETMRTPAALVLAVVAFVVLRRRWAPVWVVVAGAAVLGLVLGI